jgi:hypothetical protein
MLKVLISQTNRVLEPRDGAPGMFRDGQIRRAPQDLSAAARGL